MFSCISFLFFPAIHRHSSLKFAMQFKLLHRNSSIMSAIKRLKSAGLTGARRRRATPSPFKNAKETAGLKTAKETAGLRERRHAADDDDKQISDAFSRFGDERLFQIQDDTKKHAGWSRRKAQSIAKRANEARLLSGLANRRNATLNASRLWNLVVSFCVNCLL